MFFLLRFFLALLIAGQTLLRWPHWNPRYSRMFVERRQEPLPFPAKLIRGEVAEAGVRPIAHEQVHMVGEDRPVEDLNSGSPASVGDGKANLARSRAVHASHAEPRMPGDVRVQAVGTMSEGHGGLTDPGRQPGVIGNRRQFGIVCGPDRHQKTAGDTLPARNACSPNPGLPPGVRQAISIPTGGDQNRSYRRRRSTNGPLVVTTRTSAPPEPSVVEIRCVMRPCTVTVSGKPRVIGPLIVPVSSRAE